MSLSLVKDAALGATLPVHPAAEIFPPMSDDAFNALVVDILANGLRDPIVLADGAILDGRHRARACAQAGVALKTVEWDRAGTPEAFVVSRNLHRRHLNESQRAMVAAKIATLKQGTRTDIAEISAMSQQEAASLLNVGRHSVQFAQKVQREGTPAEIAAVEAGTAAVSAVARQIKQRKHEVKMDAASAPPAAAPAIAKGARVVVPTGLTLEQACREAMAREAAGAAPDDAAASSGLSPTSYPKIRDIVWLADRTDLTAAQRQVVDGALARMNADRQIGPAHALVAPVIARVCGSRKGAWSRGGAGSSDRAAARRRDAWEHALGVVSQSCAAFGEVTLPHLPIEEARRHAAVIARAVDTLRQIGRDIVEINT